MHMVQSHSSRNQFKAFMLASALVLSTAAAHAAKIQPLPNEAFEDKLISKTMAALNQNILGMKCGELEKTVLAYKSGGIKVTHETPYASSTNCVRNDITNEPRIFFKQIELKIESYRSGDSFGSGLNVQAKYPIGFIVNESSALALLEQIGSDIAADYLTPVNMISAGPVTGSINASGGALKKTFRTKARPTILFELILKVRFEPKNEFGAGERQIIEISSNWEA